jgi:hypothetical protein
MLDANPVAESMTIPPLPLGSFAETVKCRFPPTVAFWALGTVMSGRTFDETTVITTYVWADEKPSATTKLIVYVPGASVVVGVHVNVPERGEVPCAVVKLAPDGNWLAESVKIGVGMEESVAVTVNVRVDV